MPSPASADVVIVGGSVNGCSAAWHLRTDGFTGKIVVVERDPTYLRASAFRAMGGIRQQFGTPVMVKMVQYSVGLWKEFDDRFVVDGYKPRTSFAQRGYLFLADIAASAMLMRRYQLAQGAGAKVDLLSRDDIRALVPDLMLDDIIYGLLGPDDGYANPREVLFGFREAAQKLGVQFVTGDVVAVNVENDRVVGVQLSDGSGISTPVVVNAAGPWGGRLASSAGLQLPIEPVRQTLFRATLPKMWPYRFPMVIDPGGVHWRHDDPVYPNDPDRIIVAFTKWNEPPGENFTADSQRWTDEFLPALKNRLPAFGELRDVEGWAGLYEMTPDHNPIFGEHPSLRGFIFANGFSGHGLMMSPATGKIVSEFVRLGRSDTFDVSVFAPDRFARGALISDAATI